MAVSKMPGDVAAVFAGWPEAVQARLGEVRAAILETAAETGTGPLTETLKWGQPAYLTEATGTGTTLRLGYAAGAERPIRLYVHCGTSLVGQFRDRFGDALAFEGKRAVCLSDADPLPMEALKGCIAMALTYHLEKKVAHG